MQKITQISGSGIPLFLDDIDTDRIIPARYLRCVTFDGLGEHAFEDDRRQDSSHPFDDPRFKGASVLIAGRNFGCGSSREHAPQSLLRWGIQAIVAESFAEIFFGNCSALGVPCVSAPRAALAEICDLIRSNPATVVTVNLEALTVSAGSKIVPVTMVEGARSALTTGQWDFLGQLLDARPQIAAAASKLPYLAGYSGV